MSLLKKEPLRQVFQHWHPSQHLATYQNNMSRLDFQYEELNEILEPPSNMYNWPGPCLRRGVASWFDTVFGCVKVCGGLSYSFFKRLTANSNQYARLNSKQHPRHGAIFTRIVRGCSYSITRTHPIYKHLKTEYDAPAETRKRRRSSDEAGDMRSDIFEMDTQESIAEDESVWVKFW